jgi:hypothetical protein
MSRLAEVGFQVRGWPRKGILHLNVVNCSEMTNSLSDDIPRQVTGTGGARLCEPGEAQPRESLTLLPSEVAVKKLRMEAWLLGWSCGHV